jgi:hypothetical protein
MDIGTDHSKYALCLHFERLDFWEFLAAEIEEGRLVGLILP